MPPADPTGGPQVAPVLGGERVERGESVPVAIELGGRLGVLGVKLRAEALPGRHGVGFGRRLGHLVQQLLGSWLQALGHRIKDIRRLVHPAALLACTGEDVPEGGPRAQRAIAGHKLGRVQAAGLEVAQHDRP